MSGCKSSMRSMETVLSPLLLVCVRAVTCISMHVQHTNLSLVFLIAVLERLLLSPHDDRVAAHTGDRGEQVAHLTAESLGHESSVREARNMNTVGTDGEGGVEQSKNGGKEADIVDILSDTACARIPSCSYISLRPLRIHDDESLLLCDSSQIRIHGKVVCVVAESVQQVDERAGSGGCVRRRNVNEVVANALGTTSSSLSISNQCVVCECAEMWRRIGDRSVS